MQPQTANVFALRQAVLLACTLQTEILTQWRCCTLHTACSDKPGELFCHFTSKSQISCVPSWVVTSLEMASSRCLTIHICSTCTLEQHMTEYKQWPQPFLSMHPSGSCRPHSALLYYKCLEESNMLLSMTQKELMLGPSQISRGPRIRDLPPSTRGKRGKGLKGRG